MTSAATAKQQRLPPPVELERICKGLAALDAMMSEDLRRLHDGTSWTLRGNAVPMADDLAILSGDPKKYVAYAADYFEATLPVAAVAHVLAGKRLDAKLVKRISTERTLAELKADLAEIAY